MAGFKKSVSGFVLVCLILFSACDCLQRIQVQVVDAQSAQGLDSVFFQLDEPNNLPQPADSNGIIRIDRLTGGLHDCSCLPLKVFRNKYDTLYIKVKNESREQIQLHKR